MSDSAWQNIYSDEPLPGAEEGFYIEWSDGIVTTDDGWLVVGDWPESTKSMSDREFLAPLLDKDGSQMKDDDV